MYRAYLFLIIFLLSVTCPMSGFADKEQASMEIYEQRYIDRFCPPEYPENQEHIIMVIELGHTGEKMRKVFGEAAPESMNDITLLSDETDPSACMHFSQKYESLINKQARFFDGGEAEYWHDLTFYQSSHFYFIVIGGGLLIQEDPNQPGNESVGTSSIGGIEIFYKDSLEWVDLELMEEAASVN